MNARVCIDSLLVDDYCAQVSAKVDLADLEDIVAAEIGDAMTRNLCRGDDVKVPAVKVSNGDEAETDVTAFSVLEEHMWDDEAGRLLRALLRTDCAEARALVEYAARRHSWHYASDIRALRQREALEYFA